MLSAGQAKGEGKTRDKHVSIRGEPGKSQARAGWRGSQGWGWGWAKP